MKHFITISALLLFYVYLFGQPQSLINKSDTILYLPYQDGKATFSYKGKMGIIDSMGKVIVPATFSSLDREYDNDGAFPYRFYRDKGKKGVLNRELKIVIPIGTYDDIEFMIDGMFTIKKDGKYSFADSSGKEIGKWFDKVKFFRHGLAPVEIQNKWGFINKSGHLIIENKFSEVHVFAPNGLAAVKQNGKWGFVDITGKTIIEPVYEKTNFFWGNACAVKLNGKWGYIDMTNNLIIPFQYEEAGSFSTDLALVKFQGKYGFINIKNEVIIPFQFNKANNFYENGLYARVKVNGKWTHVDKKGNIVKLW
jgi:hypothetical protein